MGPDNFQKGIQEFLKTYAFKNAATADLWRALQVKKFMLLLVFVKISKVLIITADCHPSIGYYSNHGYLDKANGLPCFELHHEWEQIDCQTVSILIRSQ